MRKTSAMVISVLMCLSLGVSVAAAAPRGNGNGHAYAYGLYKNRGSVPVAEVTDPVAPVESPAPVAAMATAPSIGS